MNENELMELLAERTAEKENIESKYREKAKVKALTTAERLDRIEELLGLK